MTEDDEDPDAPKKAVRFHIRVSPERRNRWKLAAEREERSLSSWIRLAADDRVKKSMEMAPKPRRKRKRKR